MTGPVPPPTRFTMFRDVVAFMFGLTLMGHQAFVVPPKDFNWILFLIAGAMTGIPGLAQLLPIIFGRGATGPQPSPLPPSAPQQPSPLSSSEGSGVEP